MARYAAKADLDWAWWPINGTQSAGYNRVRGAVETYGLLNPDWDGYANQELLNTLRGIQRTTC
jgi:endoglucanase